VWVLFTVPCPTPLGESAEDLYQKRVDLISDAMRESAVTNGCRFHRAWYAADGSAFWAIANWETADGANRFFNEWDIADEVGEVMIRLEGDIGLVPLG
jgi:hypothetical protein